MPNRKTDKSGKISKLSQGYYFLQLAGRLSVVLLLFSCCRAIFYIFNIQSFSGSTTAEIMEAFLYGLRFDVSAILYFNTLTVLMFLLPLPLRARRGYRIATMASFYLFNGTALLLNVIDFEYFKFAKKRMTFDLMTMKGDLISLLPEYLKNYWYLALIFAAFIVLIWYLSSKISSGKTPPRLNHFTQWIILIISAGFFLIGARGGIQLKPLKVLDASLRGTPETVPLILNSPFTFIQSYGKKRLAKSEYMPGDEAVKLYPIYHPRKSVTGMKKMNVMIIIVESLSREFMSAYGSGKSRTPFLDSLAESSLLCVNSYANGTRSMEAIPAVLASIPHLMPDSYIYSAYQGNRINSLASLLGLRGYETAFFHGGNNGTMGFDSFVRMAGIRKYFGRNEHNNESDFDGLWGIYDEEFLQFTARTLDGMEQPFCSALFTLSSHEPVSIPAKHKDDFHKGATPIERGIEYADFAIGKFFKSASGMDWYRNTLFVITGDHTPGRTEDPWFQTRLGMFEVPIIFYSPGGLPGGRHERITSHVDIMPSVLDYLAYDGDYVSFGKSIFDPSNEGLNFNLVNESYQLLQNHSSILSDGDKILDFGASLSRESETPEIPSRRAQIGERMLRNLRAVLQTYRNAMIEDRLTADSYRNK